MTTFIHVAALTFYVVAAYAYINRLLSVDTPVSRNARYFQLVGTLLHTAGIGMFCIRLKLSPFESGFGTLSVGSWSISLLLLAFDFAGKMKSLGSLVSPICALLLSFAFARSGNYRHSEGVIKSGAISSHVMLIMFSFAFFVVAACCGLFYVWQYSVLKNPSQKLGKKKLPPLETVDRAAQFCVSIAFPLLTIGLMLGFTSLQNSTNSFSVMSDPHAVVTIVAWLTYVSYLFARFSSGWKGVRLNYLLIFGMLLSLALYIIPSHIHSFT